MSATEDNNKPDNMRIWDQVHEVPREVTKAFTRNGDELTAIAPVWYFEMATKMWGPLGQGWGIEVMDDDFVCDAHGTPVLHYMRVSLWYDGALIPDDHKSDWVKPSLTRVVGIGCTQMQYEAGGKMHWDDDFNKKTLTDAITNALSRLGFGADIRKRSYEGSKYVGPAGVQGEHDPDMTAAWDEYVTWARKTYPGAAETMSDMELCARAAEKLQDHQRKITPDNVRGLIVKPD